MLSSFVNPKENLQSTLMFLTLSSSTKKEIKMCTRINEAGYSNVWHADVAPVTSACVERLALDVAFLRFVPSLFKQLAEIATILKSGLFPYLPFKSKH